ncbi:hypothetical protein H8E07_22240 [bacterium]|nr:hypothetical protein [bacterium]
MRREIGTIVFGMTLWLCAVQAGAQVGAPAAAPPDTVDLTLALPEDAPRLVLRSAGPDSVLFGGEISVVCALVNPSQTTVLDSLSCPTAWAEVTARDRSAEDEVILRLRLMRAGPFRIVWADGPRTEEIFHVVGRLGQADQPAPLRDPRRLGWYWWRLLLAVLIAAGLLLLYRRWRREAEGVDLYSDPLPPPAWMQTVIDLCGLHDGGLAARGEGRAFLHELDVIFRRFLAGRYHLKAVEMTPEEILTALAERSYPTRLGQGVVDILGRCDQQRFSPGEVATRPCHEFLREVIDMVAENRVMAVQTHVSTVLEVEASRCWNRLDEQVPHTGPAGSGGGHV